MIISFDEVKSLCQGKTGMTPETLRLLRQKCILGWNGDHSPHSQHWLPFAQLPAIHHHVKGHWMVLLDGSAVWYDTIKSSFLLSFAFSIQSNFLSQTLIRYNWWYCGFLQCSSNINGEGTGSFHDNTTFLTDYFLHQMSSTRCEAWPFFLHL